MASTQRLLSRALLMLTLTFGFAAGSRSDTQGQSQARRLLIDIGGINIDIPGLPPLPDINIPPVDNLVPNLPPLPPVSNLPNINLPINNLSDVNQVLGSFGIPSLSSLNLNNLPSWSTLQQIFQSKIPVNPGDISAPATLKFNLSSGCPADVNSTTVLNNAVRVIAARGVNVDPSNVEVTGVSCQGNQAQVNLAFLGNSTTTTTTQLQGYANRLQNNAGQIFDSVSPDVLNNLGIVGVSAGTLVNQGSNAAQQICTPLPGCVFNDVTQITIPPVIDGVTSQLLQPFQGSAQKLLQVVPFQLALPVDCQQLVGNDTQLAQFKQQLQSAVADQAGLPVGNVNITQVACNGQNYTIANVQYLLNQSVSIPEMVQLVNLITIQDWAQNLPNTFTNTYNSARNTVFSNFNLATFPLALQNLAAPVPVAMSGVQQYLTPVNLNVEGNCSKVQENPQAYNAAMQVAWALNLQLPAQNIDITNVTCNNSSSINTTMNVLFPSNATNATVTGAQQKLSNASVTSIPQSVQQNWQVQSISVGDVIGFIGKVINGPSPSQSPAPTPAPTPGATTTPGTSGSPTAPGASPDNSNNGNSTTLPGGGTVVFPSPAAATTTGVSMSAMLLTAGLACILGLLA